MSMFLSTSPIFSLKWIETLKNKQNSTLTLISPKLLQNSKATPALWPIHTMELILEPAGCPPRAEMHTLQPDGTRRDSPSSAGPPRTARTGAGMGWGPDAAAASLVRHLRELPHRWRSQQGHVVHEAPKGRTGCLCDKHSSASDQALPALR